MSLTPLNTLTPGATEARAPIRRPIAKPAVAFAEHVKAPRGEAKTSTSNRLSTTSLERAFGFDELGVLGLRQAVAPGAAPGAAALLNRRAGESLPMSQAAARHGAAPASIEARPVGPLAEVTSRRGPPSPAITYAMDNGSPAEASSPVFGMMSSEPARGGDETPTEFVGFADQPGAELESEGAVRLLLTDGDGGLEIIAAATLCADEEDRFLEEARRIAAEHELDVSETLLNGRQGPSTPTAIKGADHGARAD